MSNFFRSWEALLDIIAGGIFTYIAFIFLLRISGKRTLAKMNMFDFIVTVAQGSILATTVLNQSVYLTEGIIASATLILAQYVVTRTSVEFDAFNKIIKAEPTILFYNGQFASKKMKYERVTEEEILAAMRETGFASPSAVFAVVMETTGQLSVIGKPASEDVTEFTIDRIPNFKDVRSM